MKALIEGHILAGHGRRIDVAIADVDRRAFTGGEEAGAIVAGEPVLPGDGGRSLAVQRLAEDLPQGECGLAGSTVSGFTPMFSKVTTRVSTLLSA